MLFLYSYHFGHRNPLVLLWFMLWLKLPEWTRRMCLLCSLYGRLSGCQVDDVERLRAFNRHFNLISEGNFNALRFPLTLSGAIWRNLTPVGRLNERNTERYIARLIKRTPCWLYYAEHETQRQDIAGVVAYCQREHA